MPHKYSRVSDTKHSTGRKGRFDHIKITPDTRYDECSERLTAFGGLLALVKFLDLVGFQPLFGEDYRAPQRKTQDKVGRVVNTI